MVPWKRVPARSRRARQEVPSIKRHILYGVLVMFVIALLCTAIWYVTRLPVFTITTVSVSGGETISHETVRARALEELAGNYLLLVPHRFSYTYPEERMRTVIQSIPRVHSVAVERVSRTEVAISFEEYIPHALWCASEADDATCYFLDETGYAFSPAPVLQGGAFLRHVVAEKGELGEQQLFAPEHIARIDAFVQRLTDELALRIKEVVHTADGDERYVLQGGGEVRVSRDGDMEKAFESLVAILSSDEFKDLEPGNFNYIDLRFGNKIFVNDSMTLPEATATEAVASVTASEPTAAQASTTLPE